MGTIGNGSSFTKVIQFNTLYVIPLALLVVSTQRSTIHLPLVKAIKCQFSETIKFEGTIETDGAGVSVIKQSFNPATGNPHLLTTTP